MRTLAIAALSYTAAVFAAVYVLPLAWLPAAALLFAVLGALLFLRRRIWLRGFALMFCALGFGFALFYGFTWLTVRPASALDGTETEIRAQLLSMPEITERYVRAEVRLHSEGLPAVKALLYENKGAVLAGAKTGDWIETKARLRPADRLYGEEYLGYQSRGIFLIANAREEISLSPGSAWLFWPQHIHRALCTLIDTVFPEDCAPFQRALMLGDKEELYQDEALHLALSHAGLMHAVAVSGMHIAFVAGLLLTVFGRSRRATALCLTLVWLYVLITGATPSAVRAGVMQTLLLLAPLFMRENDPLTSLSAALAVLLLPNPYAIANVGLQFSFASMAGILSFSERMGEAVFDRFPALRETGLRRGAIGTLVNSLSVVPFTVPLMALYFDCIPLLAPLSNLLVFGAIELCFCGGYGCVALGLVWLPLAKAAAWLLSWAARYILFAANLISSLPWAAVYLENRWLLGWLLLSYALFLGFCFVRRSPAFRLAVPAAVSLLSLGGLLLAFTLTYQGATETIAALDVGQGQCIAVLSGNSTMLIDCGGMGSKEDAGETALSYLLTRGRTRVDVLLLTHLDEDHCNGAARLMALCPVRLILTEEEPDPEKSQQAALLRAAQRCGAELRVLTEDMYLTVGGIRAEVYVPEPEAEGNGRCLAALVSLGSYDMLVTGDLPAKEEKTLLERIALPELELYIAGHHGSKHSSSAELLAVIRPETVLISSGYNTYGHPAPETLRRLAAQGCTVYRTDENGSIEIRIERQDG